MAATNTETKLAFAGVLTDIQTLPTTTCSEDSATQIYNYELKFSNIEHFVYPQKVIDVEHKTLHYKCRLGSGNEPIDRQRYVVEYKLNDASNEIEVEKLIEVHSSIHLGELRLLYT